MRRCRICDTEMPTASKCVTMICKKRLCSIDCAVTWGQKSAVTQRERAQKKAHKADKDRIKTRTDWIKEAQAAVNAYVRERDVLLPCVSCGRHHSGQYHAGHYRSVGSEPSLRFETMQIQKQCAPCNNHLSGNLINYRIELIKRIGQKKLDWIEGPHEAKHYTVDDLKAIKIRYKAKLKNLRELAA